MTTVREAPMQLTTRLKIVQWPENNTRGLAHRRNPVLKHVSVRIHLCEVANHGNLSEKHLR
jgi:hypothetical protein